MKTNQITEEATNEALASYAAHMGDTKHWLEIEAPTVVEAEKLHTLYSTAPELLEACRAGGRYSDALNRLQDEGRSGQMVEGGDLDTLFMEWHDKTHAAIAKATRA